MHNNYQNIPNLESGLDGVELEDMFGLEAAEDTFNWQLWGAVAVVGAGLWYMTRRDRAFSY